MKYEKTLNLIYSNEVMMRDLRELFEDVVKTNLPEVNQQNDEELGQQFRAHQQAQRIIKDAFEILTSLDKNVSSGGDIKFK